jgi:hypothetical protein
VFFWGYFALKIWSIILNIGQECHLLIFGFENGHSGEWRRRPMYENSFEGDEELRDDCAILKKCKLL